MRFCLGPLAAVALLGACDDPVAGDEQRCSSIGAPGGVVISHDNSLSISIRPDAVSERIDLCITPAGDGGPPDIFGPAYRIRPNIELERDARITYRQNLPDSTEGVAVGAVLREEFDAGSGRWIALPVTRVEPENNLIAASDSRLSMFYGLCNLGDCTAP